MRRGRRRSSFARGKGYRIAIEIILVVAVLEGAFFMINNYIKTRPKPVRIAAVKVKPAPAEARLPESKPEAAVAPKSEAVVKPKLEVALKSKPKAALKPQSPPGSQGKIAIVLDDWGYSLNNMRLIDEIKSPFTAAILPNLRYSGEAAEQLHKRGFEVILHLPMEPQSKMGMEKDTILTSMNEGEIKAIVREGLDNVSYACGVNNHMGSKATEDERLMREVFAELKNKRLYFLDSAVTATSVPSDLARSMKMPFIKRDVFLDNRLEPEYIRGQFNKLKAIAAKKGFAVGVGHDRKVTLEVLKEIMPESEKEGYQFVFVSELVEPNTNSHE
ncbi:MAG: divergent polysaccharide deacetylase family protein [Candidatus Omnitrophota bacterium]